MGNSEPLEYHGLITAVCEHVEDGRTSWLIEIAEDYMYASWYFTLELPPIEYTPKRGDSAAIRIEMPTTALNVKFKIKSAPWLDVPANEHFHGSVRHNAFGARGWLRGWLQGGFVEPPPIARRVAEPVEDEIARLLREYGVEE